MLDRNLCLELESPSAGQVTTGFILEGNASSNTLRNIIVRAYRVLDAQYSPNLSVINNTFTNDLALPDDFNPAIIHLLGSPKALIDNNIFYDPLEDLMACDLASESGLSADYNITYRSDGAAPNGSPNPHDL